VTGDSCFFSEQQTGYTEAMQGTAVICQRFSILHEHQVVPAGFMPAGFFISAWP
jgi:hypothetical protein